jgi:universal stress protein A
LRIFCARTIFGRSFCGLRDGAAFLIPDFPTGPAVAIPRGIMSSPRRILVATDFSDGSDEALTQAITLAKQTNAEMEIVYVLELGVEEFPFGLTPFGSDLGALTAYVDRELGNRAARAVREGVPCRTKTLEGSASTEVIQRARQIGAELVVVGTHGRTGLAHILLGSVAEKIVRRSICPVLTVPFSKKAA